MNATGTKANDPPVLPETGFLREPEVLRRVPVSHSTLWRWVRSQRFPEPVQLGPNTVGWRVEDLRDWMAQPTSGTA